MAETQDTRRQALCAAIAEARRERMSQKELARRLDVPQPYISRWETQRPPRRETLAQIEEALELPLGTLLRAAGYIGEEVDIAAAIRADTRLTPEYQDMVLRFYEQALEGSATARAKRDAPVKVAPRSTGATQKRRAPTRRG